MLQCIKLYIGNHLLISKRLYIIHHSFIRLAQLPGLTVGFFTTNSALMYTIQQMENVQKDGNTTPEQTGLMILQYPLIVKVKYAT